MRIHLNKLESGNGSENSKFARRCSRGTLQKNPYYDKLREERHMFQIINNRTIINQQFRELFLINLGQSSLYFTIGQRCENYGKFVWVTNRSDTTLVRIAR